MALMDFIKKQFIDILQWTEDGDGTLAWRFPMAGNGNPERRQPDRARIAAGAVRQRRQGGRCLRARHVQADDADAAGADLPEELGQAVRVPVQVRRLLLLHAHSSSTRSGARRTRSPSATRNSASCACAPSASTAYHLSRRQDFLHRRFPARATPTRAEELEGQLRNTMVCRHHRPVRRIRRCLHRHGGQPGRVRQGA